MTSTELVAVCAVGTLAMSVGSVLILVGMRNQSVISIAKALEKLTERVEKIEKNASDYGDMVQGKLGEWDGICLRRRGDLFDKLAAAEKLAVDTKARWETGHQSVIDSIAQLRHDLEFLRHTSGK